MYILYDNIQIDTESLPPEERENFSPEYPSLYPAFINSFFNDIDTPYFIATIYFHPDDVDNHYIYTKYTPRHTLHMCYSKTEFLQHIKKDLHRHNFFEFLYVLKGSVYQNIEYSRRFYPAGSCCLFTKNVAHIEEYGDSEAQLVFLGIEPSFLEQLIRIISLDLFSDQTNDINNDPKSFFETKLMSEHVHDKNYIDFIPVSKKEPPIQEVCSVLNALIMQTLFPDKHSSMRIMGCFLQFFTILTNREHYRIAYNQIGTPAENRLFEQITDILQSSNGHVSRQELEHQLNYTGDYLNKITKKQTGLNLFQYGMVFCMKKAADLLLTTDLPVSAIAAELGFLDRTHFYRIFEKAYHTTPAKYRKMHRKQKSS